MIRRILRALRKPPRVVAKRAVLEARAQVNRYLLPRRARRFDRRALLRALGAPSLDALWTRLAARPFAAWLPDVNADVPDVERRRIVDAADEALAHRVDLLGSGTFELGHVIDWHKDFKTNHDWPVVYARDIDYVNLDRPSDVKVPWELSRMQWLIPAAQAWRLSGDERYARAVRTVIEQWIEANPYGMGVNWAIAMEAALRILTWTWLFHMLSQSEAWKDARFRADFLRALFLHAEFVIDHLEYSDINGNHYTADAAGLVFAGLFFGDGEGPRRWTSSGWEILTEEMPRQVFSDGVDFEASIAYQRLVLELFFLPALYRRALGLSVPGAYVERLHAMARFVGAYSRGDGGVPLVGDADDGRALPLGSLSLSDHRYLVSLVAQAWGGDALPQVGGDRAEVLWLLGPAAAAAEAARTAPAQQSAGFLEGGFFVMRNAVDHVFIDCGPVGLAGRGGHGHNDCLSFEAVLMETPLISDCGAYVYTASWRERNAFRATASHNTPQVDGEEINRFIRPDVLWSLHDDAQPALHTWKTGEACDTFRGSHTGYLRLPSPVTPTRTIVLEHATHRLRVTDAFEVEGEHRFDIRVHLAPGVLAQVEDAGSILLRKDGRVFLVCWSGQGWSATLAPTRISPSYGVALDATMIAFSLRGASSTLSWEIVPVINS